MITFILLGVFAILGLAFAAIAWGANNRKRKDMGGIDKASAPRRSGEGRAVPPAN